MMGMQSPWSTWSRNASIGFNVHLLSVVLRQKHGRYRLVSLGDEIELGAVFSVIHGKKPKAALERDLVLLAVVLVEVSPVAGLMPLYGDQDVLLGQSLEGVRGRDEFAQSEERNGNFLRTHKPWSSKVEAMPSSSSPNSSTIADFIAVRSASGLACFGQAGQRRTSRI